MGRPEPERAGRRAILTNTPPAGKMPIQRQTGRESVLPVVDLIRRKAKAMRAGLALALAIATGMVGLEARAAGRYDGNWAIMIFGLPGPCAFFYRLPLSITGETVLYKGRSVSPTAISVTSRGAVAFRLGNGNNIVTGTGALDKRHGQGRWTAPSFRCTGFWRAIRQ